MRSAQDMERLLSFYKERILSLVKFIASDYGAECVQKADLARELNRRTVPMSSAAVQREDSTRLILHLLPRAASLLTSNDQLDFAKFTDKTVLGGLIEICTLAEVHAVQREVLSLYELLTRLKARDLRAGLTNARSHL
ncbi:MAG TPA: hypothetical protein VFZ48_03945 [Candidatus Saccharimonadales bacterium]